MLPASACDGARADQKSNQVLGVSVQNAGLQVSNDRICQRCASLHSYEAELHAVEALRAAMGWCYYPGAWDMAFIAVAIAAAGLGLGLRLLWPRL